MIINILYTKGSHLEIRIISFNDFMEGTIARILTNPKYSDTLLRAANNPPT